MPGERSGQCRNSPVGPFRQSRPTPSSRAFISLRYLLPTMANRQHTGPWVLALGTLAIGVGAVIAEVRRRRADAENRFEAAMDP